MDAEGRLPEAEGAEVVADAEPIGFDDGRAALRAASQRRAFELLAHDQGGQRLGITPFGRDGGDDASPAHDRHLIREGEDLAELVRDEDDGAALARQAAQHAEQVVRLLRREHTGRLVEDQDVRLAVELPHDLQPLARTHAQVGDGRFHSIVVPSSAARARARASAAGRSKKTPL